MNGCVKPNCKWCAKGECWGTGGASAGSGAQASSGPRVVSGANASMARSAGYGACGGKGMVTAPQGKGFQQPGQARAGGTWNAQAQQGQSVQWQKKPVAQAGQSGSAADRSRTPVARSAAPPAKPPPSASGLPHPWEEHFSDEHQIPYYWNADSGEAVWEKGQCK